MKKLSLILFVLLIAFTITTCKKYPRDIPKWLKIKIDKMEKESPRNGCRYDACRKVEEYTDGSSTFYWISTGTANPIGYVIYDYDGKEVCIAPAYSSSPCGNYGYSKKLVRLIWQEN